MNTSIMASLVLLLNQIFNWNLTLNDITPYMPLIVGVIFFTYRLSLALASLSPWLGKVLFLINEPPSYTNTPLPPPAPSSPMPPPPPGAET